MKPLLRGELLKVRTTRMVYWLAAASLFFALAGVAGTIATGDTTDELRQEAAEEGEQATFNFEVFPLDTPQGVRTVVSNAGAGGILVLVLGILGMAGEFRHRTVSQTFLTTPDRGRVVAAKMVVHAGVGLVYGVLCSVLTLAVALPWLSSRGADVSLADGDVWKALAGVMATLALYAMVGVGVGALVRNSVAAVVVALAWTFVVEGLVIAFLPDIGRWLPGNAATALSGVAEESGRLLSMWTGGLVFAAYGVAFAVIGTRFVVRRDVT